MVKKYTDFIFESKSNIRKNLVRDICVGMVLINPEFLDNILDKGLISRYTENTHSFIQDLKNLLMGRNRLNIGIFKDNRCIIDEEASKINAIFNGIQFDIKTNWKELIDARLIARSIIDKLLPDEKLTPDRIKYVFLNIDEEHKEDIVIELSDDKQYSFFLNKNASSSKSSSFNTFADDIIGNELDNLYGPEYIYKWNKLVQKWVRIIYNNSNKNIQQHIEKFIDEDRIDSLDYFSYFKIIHRDPRYRHLGEFMKEFDKNILYFSDLMTEIWKKREELITDKKAYREWMRTKIYVLNSRIIEHVLTESIVKNNPGDIKKLKSGFKLAEGKLKMKIVKTIVEKLGCTETPTYYLSNSGNNFTQIPSREFFRTYYNDLTIKFDYHVKLTVKEKDDNDFIIKVKLELDHSKLIDVDILIKFSGSEFSDKLTCKYKFDIPVDFNTKISKKTTVET